MSGWGLPAMNIPSYSPVPPQSALIADAAAKAPLTAATQQADLTGAQAKTAQNKADIAAAPAQGEAATAQAQAQGLGANMSALKQYSQILRSSPQARTNPLIQAALAKPFAAMGLQIPKAPDGGIDVEAIDKLTNPQPSWADLPADDLKKWEQQPSDVRRAKFPDAPEEWLAKPVSTPMTPVEETALYNRIDTNIAAAGKGQLGPQALLPEIKSARARLQSAEMSTMGVDQYLSEDGQHLAPALIDQVTGQQVETQIKRYRDLGIHMQDEDALKKKLQDEKKREFDQNYKISQARVSLEGRKLDLQAQNMARIAQQGAERLQQGWQGISLRQQEFGLNASKFQQAQSAAQFRAFDTDFRSMTQQLETNKRAIQTAINSGHPPKPDSDLMQSTTQLQQTLYGTPGDGTQPAVPGLAAQVDAMRSQFFQQPATAFTLSSGQPSRVTGQPPATSKGTISRDAAIRIGKGLGLSPDAAVKDAEKHGYTVQ
jgi:hypothetical protein